MSNAPETVDGVAITKGEELLLPVEEALPGLPKQEPAKENGIYATKIKGLLENMKRVSMGPPKKVRVPGEPCPQCGRPVVLLNRAQRRSQFHQAPPKALICLPCRLIYT